MPKTSANGASDAGAPFQLPADLSTLTAEQVAALREQAKAELDAILDQGRTAENLPKAQALGEALTTLKARGAEIAEAEAKLQSDFDSIVAQTADDPEPTDAPDGGEGSADGDAPADPAVVPGAPDAAGAAPQLVTASGRPVGGAVTASRETGGLAGGKNRLNPSLSGIRSTGPAQQAPQAQLAITASVGLPGAFEAGAQLANVEQLGQLAEQRARNLGDAGAGGAPRRKRRHNDPYGGVQIASIRNDFEDKFTDQSSVEAVQRYVDKISKKTLPSEMASMVASGGWCAPSQIRYDFFNIAEECGMIDLPTFGVERGGIQFPISPSLADTFSPALPWYTAFSNATVPWLWTEGDDILAATGSPTKPCIDVPCSTMDNRRLECYGICLTAGNLADNAWPESTRNFLRLLMAAHYHASNARYISTIASLADSFTACAASGTGAAAPLLMTAELGAIDYRAKFGMCDDAVIEAVYPNWVKGLIRADLAKRTGVSDFMAVPDAEIARWFDVRNIRAQFVADYQVRAAGQPGASAGITSYPTTVRHFLYAPGTVARGNGMSLDLGIVRDSTLNATNDFTAAWMEECHLIAQFGHEVREYTVNVCADGTTGAADLTACC